MKLLFERFSSNGASLSYQDFIHLVGRSDKEDEFTDGQKERKRVNRNKPRVSEPVSKRDPKIKLNAATTRDTITKDRESGRTAWDVELSQDLEDDTIDGGDSASGSAQPESPLHGVLKASNLQARVQKKLQSSWHEICPALHELQQQNQSFGRIDNDDFKKVLHGLDIGFSPRELTMLVSAVDKEGYGAIDFFEFARKIESVDGTIRPLPFFRKSMGGRDPKSMGLYDNQGKASGRRDRRRAATDRIIPSRQAAAERGKQSRQAIAFTEHLKQIKRGPPVSTRYGLTDYHDTSWNISGDPDMPNHAGIGQEGTRFTQESRQYGASRPANSEEKKRLKEQEFNRLERVRQNKARVEANNIDREKDEQAHERRVHALIRQRVKHYERLRGRVERDRRRQQVYIDAFS